MNEYDYNQVPQDGQSVGGPDPQNTAFENNGYNAYQQTPYTGNYNAQPAAGQIPQQPYGQPEMSGQQSGGYTPAGMGYQNAGYQQPAQQSGYQADPAAQTYQQPGFQAYNAQPGYQSYNPQPDNGGYQYNPQPNVQPEAPKPKKHPKAARNAIIAAVLVVCLLIGGFAGAAISRASGNKADNETGSAAEDTTMQAETPAESEQPQNNGTNDNAAADDNTGADAAAPSGDAEPAQTNDNGNIDRSVNLQTTTNSTETSMTPQDVYENYVNAVVAISNEGTTTNIFGQSVTSASSGSGFIIDSDGYIVTNNHVVEDATTLTVMLTNGDEYDATIIGADEENDVALIKIDATDLPTVPLGDSDSMAVGEQVCAIGNPLGELTNTLTVGYVSALDREIAESSTVTINMFQTDCAINAGNSGGPLFDMNGNVIGITTAKYSSSSSTSASIEGIGFCIPINDAMDIVSDLLEYGYVPGRASLGISCQTISETVTQYYNLPTGVYVAGVNEGSAAANAGIQEGDIITAIDDTETASVSDLKLALKNYSAGDTATLTVYRSGETLTVTVTLDEQSQTTAEESTGQSQDSQSQEGQQSGTSPFGSGSGSYPFG